MRKGLEEFLEEKEKEDIFLRRVSMHVSMIFISSVLLFKDVVDFISSDIEPLINSTDDND
jgi:hypothetical protein